MLRLASCLVVATVLGGCSSFYQGYEGVSDYRKAVWTEAEAGKKTLPLTAKYEPVDADGPIKAGETLSVHLTQGFIKEFHESGEKLNPLVATRGEIAIVMKVTELERAGLDFDPKAVRTGRLVFYSGDVRDRDGGQFLNLSNMPVYGPTKFNGHSLAIEVFVIELDEAENVKMQNLLTSLSAIGGVAYPPASKILPILDQIGSQLLGGNRDDMEMTYRLVLDPSASGGMWVHPALEVGHYALIRRNVDEAFAHAHDWDSLRYDPNTGRVTKDEAGAVEFHDGTYLTLRIDSGLPEVGDFTAQTLADLEDKLKEYAKTEGVFADGFVSSLQEKVIRPMQEKATEKARDHAVETVRALIRDYRIARKRHGAQNATDDVKAKARVQMVADLRNLHGILLPVARALGGTAAEQAAADLTARQFTDLLAELQTLALASDDAGLVDAAGFVGKFVTFASFRAAFIAP